MQTSQIDLETLLQAFWSAGPMARAFAVMTAAALVALGVVLARTKFVLSLRTDEFLRQIDKLVGSSNAVRAVKLSGAHDGPVARLTRAGLVAAVEGGHRRSPAEQARRARDEMERQRPRMLALATRDFLVARLLGAAAFSVGVAALLGPAAGSLLVCVALLGLVAAGLLSTVLEARKFARDLQSVVETVSGTLRVAPGGGEEGAEATADFFGQTR
ncbi:MAG: hypothetical protein ACYC8T_38515 [Myxococcaceae bacterium]